MGNEASGTGQAKNCKSSPLSSKLVAIEDIAVCQFVFVREKESTL